jgi:hypothetical protein
VWESELPDVSDKLRQGDLIAGVDFPRIDRLRVAPTQIEGVVRPNRSVIVLEQCCSIDYQHSVLLSEVGRTRPLPPDHRYLAALRSRDASGLPYAFYEHLLEPHPALDPGPDRYSVARLLYRFSFIDLDGALLLDLQSRRVARMTPLARAHLRSKLAAHFGAPEDTDEAWLRSHGYDGRGEGLHAEQTQLESNG